MVSKKTICSLLLIFTVILLQQNSFSQDQKLSNKYLSKIKKQYDKFRNSSSYSMYLSGGIGNNGLSVKAIAFHKGEKLPAEDDAILYGLYFINSSVDGWQYLDYHPLKFLINGKVTDFGKINHDGNVGSGYVLEMMNINTGRPFLNSLAFAKNAEFQLGLTEMTFSTTMKEKLQSFLIFLNNE